MQGVWNKKNSKLQRSRGHHAVELFYNFITDKITNRRGHENKIKTLLAASIGQDYWKPKKHLCLFLMVPPKKVSKLCHHEKTTKSIRNIGATTKIVIPFSRNVQMKPTTTQGRIFTTSSGRSGFCDGRVS